MKKLIAFILSPITFIFFLLKSMLELSLPIFECIGNGVNNILDKNYEFWKKNFNWR